MTLRCLTMSLLLTIGPARRAQAQDARAPDSPAHDQPVTRPDAGGSVDSDAATADTSSDNAAGDNPSDANVPSAASSGELVRLSRLPSAELMVKVALSANDEHATLEVAAVKSGATLLRCQGACRFEIWPGEYRLNTVASSGYLSGKSTFVVERNADIRVTVPRTWRRAEGIVLTLLGLASVATGATLMLSSTCSRGCQQHEIPLHRAAFIAFSSGVVLTPIGGMLVVQSLDPHVEVIPN
jgi:hypothetical protein